jgi:hypothetical protein
VLAEYVQSKGAIADGRLKMPAITLLDGISGADVAGPVPPGHPLTLDIDLTADAPLVRCGLLIQVLRSDGLVIFTGMSTLDGLPDFDLQPEDKLHARINFSANVLRGTYIINLQLVDTLRQWGPAIVNGAASFVVSETTRAAGCAELSPSYDITVSSAATSAARTGTP